MKTKNGIILLLICIGIFTSEAFAAVDYTFKTNVTRTETRSIVPDNSPNCDGSTPTMPTINYDVTIIDSQFTDFSFRIVKKSDLSAYYNSLNHTVITSGGSQNFDLTNGELTYTITGIPKTNEILIVRFYKNAGGTGSPYYEQEISISSNTRPQAGFVTFGNVGDNSDGGGAGAITATGGAISSASINNAPMYSEITVNFTDLGDANYVAMVSLESTNGTRFNSNNVSVPVIYDKTSSSFKVLLEDNGVSIEDLRLDIIIQAY
ncbi:MAG: hypothetical protein HYZ54_13565 [Ignavibacteriae bacterium]|nr:hypothetical protein [Ignavibacteriota bacterium]